MKYRNLHVFITSALLITSVASAGDKLSRAEAAAVVDKVFNVLDCDIDGVIDRLEIDEHFAQLWLPLDTDRSGALSKLEYTYVHRAVPEATAKKLFADADADKDKNVTPIEFQKHMERMIQIVDDEGDGDIMRDDVGFKPVKEPIKMSGKHDHETHVHHDHEKHQPVETESAKQ